MDMSDVVTMLKEELGALDVDASVTSFDGDHRGPVQPLSPEEISGLRARCRRS